MRDAKIKCKQKRVASAVRFCWFTLVPQAGVAIGLAMTAMTVVPEFGTKIRTIILCGTVIYELTGPVNS